MWESSVKIEHPTPGEAMLKGLRGPEARVTGANPTSADVGLCMIHATRDTLTYSTCVACAMHSLRIDGDGQTL